MALFGGIEEDSEEDSELEGDSAKCFSRTGSTCNACGRCLEEDKIRKELPIVVPSTATMDEGELTTRSGVAKASSALAVEKKIKEPRERNRRRPRAENLIRIEEAGGKKKEEDSSSNMERGPTQPVQRTYVRRLLRSTSPPLVSSEESEINENRTVGQPSEKSLQQYQPFHQSMPLVSPAHKPTNYHLNKLDNGMFRSMEDEEDEELLHDSISLRKCPAQVSLIYETGQQQQRSHKATRSFVDRPHEGTRGGGGGAMVTHELTISIDKVSGRIALFSQPQANDSDYFVNYTFPKVDPSGIIKNGEKHWSTEVGSLTNRELLLFSRVHRHSFTLPAMQPLYKALKVIDGIDFILWARDYSLPDSNIKLAVAYLPLSRLLGMEHQFTTEGGRVTRREKYRLPLEGRDCEGGEMMVSITYKNFSLLSPLHEASPTPGECFKSIPRYEACRWGGPPSPPTISSQSSPPCPLFETLSQPQVKSSSREDTLRSVSPLEDERRKIGGEEKGTQTSGQEVNGQRTREVGSNTVCSSCSDLAPQVKMFRARVEVERAFNCSEACSRVSFVAYDATGQQVEFSTPFGEPINPIWNASWEVSLPIGHLISVDSLLNFTLRAEEGIIGGSCGMDLTPLSAGLPQLSGWFRFSSPVDHSCAQIKIVVTPLEDISVHREGWLKELSKVNFVKEARASGFLLLQGSSFSSSGPPDQNLGHHLRKTLAELDEVMEKIQRRVQGKRSPSPPDSLDSRRSMFRGEEEPDRRREPEGGSQLSSNAPQQNLSPIPFSPEDERFFNYDQMSEEMDRILEDIKLNPGDS